MVSDDFGKIPQSGVNFSMKSHSECAKIGVVGS